MLIHHSRVQCRYVSSSGGQTSCLCALIFLSLCAMLLCVKSRCMETSCCYAFTFYPRVQCRCASSRSGQRLYVVVLSFFSSCAVLLRVKSRWMDRFPLVLSTFIPVCNAATCQVAVGRDFLPMCFCFLFYCAMPHIKSRKRNKLLFYKNVVSVHVGCSWTLQKVKYSVLKIRDVSFCPFYSVYTSRNANIYFFILPLKPRWNNFRILCKARLKKFLMLYHAMEVEKNKDTRATFTSSTLSQNKRPHDLEPNICHQR